ncbi:acyl-CoA dehydrogenase [Myxococcota bacterium]|nr:acyl-CoA dehydrogenase [Myxococcota bacterium]
MNLELDEAQRILRETFSELLARECPTTHVRACEATGFSPELWARYVELGAPGMGMPEAVGGLGLGMVDLGLVAGCGGRALAPVPFAEVAVAGRLLAAVAPDDALVGAIAAGEAIVSLAPTRPEAVSGTSANADGLVLVPAGAIARAVVALEGESLVIYETDPGRTARDGAGGAGSAVHGIQSVREVGSGAHALWPLGESTGLVRRVVVRGPQVVAGHRTALAEWKLLTAFAQVGLARAALEIGARYAKERIQFGVPIGSFQAIAHPLADCATRVDGAELLCLEAAWARRAEPARFEALASMAFVWAGQTAQRTAGVSLHTHGGYGFSLEYDIQMHYRRAFAWALIAGGTREERSRIAGICFEPAAAGVAGDPGSLEPGETAETGGLDFRLGPKAERVSAEIGEFLRREFSEQDAARERREGGGHDWPLYRKLAAYGWVSAGWPKEIGGGGRDPYEIFALYWALSKAAFPWFGLMNNGFIGHTLMALGTEEQKRTLVPRIAQGEILIALGYSEPGSGSDVAAARTMARRDGDGWILEGEKMWTTTAHAAQYVFTLTRTSQQDRPHRGLTMFLVPTDAPGVEIRPVHTLGGERTNSFSLRGVRVPDSARVGEVDQGWAVVRFALGLEQAMGYADLQERLLEEASAWALAVGADGRRPFDDPRVREQLAQSAIHAEVARLLRHRSTWLAAEGRPMGAKGAMTKSFSAATYLEDAQLWAELAGPLALLAQDEPRRVAGGFFEEILRQTPVNTIYGGTVEILRSLVAEVELGLPKSR